MEMEGFEPSTFCMQGRRSSQLELHPLDGVRPWSKHCHDHVPTWWPVAELTRGPSVFQADALPTELTGRGAHGGSRTPDSRIRSPELCPLSYVRRFSAGGRVRTCDLRDQNPALFQLSYTRLRWRGGRDLNPKPRCWRPRCCRLHHLPFRVPDESRTRDLPGHNRTLLPSELQAPCVAT